MSRVTSASITGITHSSAFSYRVCRVSRAASRCSHTVSAVLSGTTVAVSSLYRGITLWSFPYYVRPRVSCPVRYNAVILFSPQIHPRRIPSLVSYLVKLADCIACLMFNERSYLIFRSLLSFSHFCILLSQRNVEWRLRFMKTIHDPRLMKPSQRLGLFLNCTLQ